MGKLAIQYAKLPETKRNSPLRIQKTKSSQPIKTPADRILLLQRTIGNQAVQRLIKSGTLQTKLKIGRPGDKYEQEADRVADAVMRMPEPGVQRQVEPEEEETLQSKPLVNQITPLVQVQRQEEPEEEEETLQAKPLAEEITPLVQRQVEPEKEEEELQAKATSSHLSETNPNLESKVHSLRGGGQPLSNNDRTFFEPRFGRDFSQVRVHTNAKAAESVNARAFTVGQDVVFGAEEYTPGTQTGRTLLAHELTHVIQQSSIQTLRRPFLAKFNPQISTNLIPVYHLSRQCNPAMAALAWNQRVTDAQGMAVGAARDQCFADLIDEALGGRVTVNQSTNGSPNVNAAIAAGHYTELSSSTAPHINFDRNLNAKTGNPNQFGYTTFRVPPGGGNIRLFIILGPQALNAIGPQYTRMAFEHEDSHATDFLLQWATGVVPHTPTPAEELAIFTENFTHYFLDLWTIDNTPPCAYYIADLFTLLFTYFTQSPQAAQDAAFQDIELFYNVRIRRNPCNLMKFRIWLQTIQNSRPAADPLVNRINGLPDLGLAKGTAPITHLTCPTPCP